MSTENPTVKLACDLIAKPSVTPNDAGCQALMIERLEAIGFLCTPLPFEDTQNFWAEWRAEWKAEWREEWRAERKPGSKTDSAGDLASEKDPGPLLVFAGHTDVVPPGPLGDWDSDPFVPTIRDGMLFGRGAADMKGSLAAMITACEDFVAHMQQSGNTPTGRIGFLITSDEEGPATHGTVRVMQWLAEEGIAIDYCVVGEPSSGERLGDTIKNGRRGSLNATLKILGRQGHVAYPQHAENPLHKALPALQALVSREWDAGNEYFPATSFQITNCQAGTGVTNVIPGHAELLINFRFSTEQTAHRLQEEVERILADHDVKAEVQWNLSGNPFITGEGALTDACRAAVREVTGIETQLSTSGGTSDGRFIAPYGAQLVELGPINASIHRVNEHVRVADLPDLAAMYQGILRRLLTGN